MSRRALGYLLSTACKQTPSRDVCERQKKQNTAFSQMPAHLIREAALKHNLKKHMSAVCRGISNTRRWCLLTFPHRSAAIPQAAQRARKVECE